MDAASIPKDYKNSYKLKHCLTVAKFSGNPWGIAVLKKEKDMNALIFASSNIRYYFYKTLLEWEGVPNKGNRFKEELITGISKKYNIP